MNKQAKIFNWERGTEELDNLVSFDYEVKAFTDIHFRINRRLDVWPSTRSWYDIRTGRKGKYGAGGLEKFVKDFLHA